MDENKLKVLNSYHVIFLVQNVIVGTICIIIAESIKFDGLQPVVDAFVIWGYRKYCTHTDDLARSKISTTIIYSSFMKNYLANG